MRRLVGPLSTVLLLSCAASLRAQVVDDSNVTVRAWLDDVSGVSGMTFLPGSSDAFIIQKDTGKVMFVHDRAVKTTALDLSVANRGEQGLLDIALHPDFGKNGFVYLSYTAAGKDGGRATANRIDRYRWDGKRLSFSKSIEKLPAGPGTTNVGGKLEFGLDGTLYALFGDQQRRERTQNRASSKVTTPTSVVLRLNASGGAAEGNPFTSSKKKSKAKEGAVLLDTWSYGIRNGGGLAIDPQTGRLWDTELGAGSYDEINLVDAGFNSGWAELSGPVSRHGFTAGRQVKLGPAAHYEDPKFSWHVSIDPGDLVFASDGAFGSEYDGDLFVAGTHGTIYHFRLNEARNDFVLTGGLADRVADNQSDNFSEEQGDIIWGRRFGRITDLEQHGGSLYVISKDRGTIYTIMTRKSPVPEPATLLPLVGLGWLLSKRRRA